MGLKKEKKDDAKVDLHDLIFKTGFNVAVSNFKDIVCEQHLSTDQLQLLLNEIVMMKSPHLSDVKLVSTKES